MERLLDESYRGIGEMIDLIPSAINGYGCLADPGEPGTNAPRLSINDVEGRILSELVRGLSVLEIGTGLGVSTKWMAKTAAGVYTVDIDPWVQEHVFPTMPGNVICLGSLPQLDRCFAAAFVDGCHDYESVRKDIVTGRLYVKRGGLLIFHDLYIEGVKRAIDEAFGDRYIHIQTIAGMALAWNDIRTNAIPPLNWK